MKQQKEKKPNVTKRKLKAAGYRYKLEELTKEQKKEQREGVKITNPKTGKLETYDPPDYNYYYRQIGNAQVKLFKVGDRFYYKNNWLRYMEQLPLIEEDAKAEAVYTDLQSQVVDTKPMPPSNLVVPGAETINLVGGPLDGTNRRYDLSFPMLIIQFTDDDGKVKSARYKRDMKIIEVDGRKVRTNDNKNVYVFDTIIG